MLDSDQLFFFEKHQAALPLYETFEQRVQEKLGPVGIRVGKTQISFFNRYNFAFVSFLPVRPAKARPKTYIVVSFGLEGRLSSPRVDVATEPYPNRWTHHVLIEKKEEIDEELMGWVCAAARFSASK